MKTSVFLILALIVLWAMDTTVHGQQARLSESTEWSDSVSVGVVERGWKFGAELYKPKTVPYEPIYMRFTLTNISDEVRIMPSLSYVSEYEEPELSLVIRNAEGKRYPLVIGHGDFTSPPDINATKRGPGEKKVFEFDLLWRIGTGSDECNLFGLPVGEYTADISLYLDPVRRVPKTENTLKLPPLSFSIVEPIGDAKEAFRLLCSAKTRCHDHAEEAVARFDSILTLYSHTPYDERTNIEYIYYRAMAHIDRDELTRLRVRYFTKYYDTPFSKGNADELVSRIPRKRMRELIGKIQDKPEALRILEYLRIRHPQVFEEGRK